jgi:hypothetical protein
VNRSLRAISLTSTLALTCLLFSLAAILLASILSSHGLTNRLECEQRARCLAESALNQAWVKLQNDPDFGLQPADSIRAKLPGNPEGAQGQIDFEGSDASLNNLNGSAAQIGWRDLPVPAHSALLVAVGSCRNYSIRLSVLLKRSAFPYAVACAGDFSCTGATRICSSGEEGQLGPADLACNGSSSKSIQLADKSLVTGDVRSVGGIVLESTAKIEGQAKPYASAVDLPTIDLSMFDPQTCSEPWQNLPVLMDSKTLSGPSRCSTHLEVLGDLTLEGATLFVNGDLTITGSLLGNGLVVVMGKTYVAGRSSLESDTQAVLLSKGNVCLQGCGPESSGFRGLVYTEDNFHAQQMSLVGSFISRGQATVIDHCEVIYDPKVTQLNQKSGLLSRTIGKPQDWTFQGQQLTQKQARKQIKTGSLKSEMVTVGDQKVKVYSAATESAESSPLLFDLNEFCSQSTPLEMVTWEENL